MTKVMATGTFDILHPGHGIYLQQAKKLGGKNAKLYVVVSRDSTVEKNKRIPIINEKQRLELIKMLKPVDQACLGYENKDMFQIVEKIQPDIIAIGPDQKHNIKQIQNEINKRGLKAQVIRVKKYHHSPLDSSCKIIKKIKNTNFKEKIKDCD